jgi:signal transduction histidine kinase
VQLDATAKEGELVVHVRDQGGGLDARTARALETGALADDAPGLGVAVVIRLVERLQGRVAVESQPGSGTSISLFFPLQEQQAKG